VTCQSKADADPSAEWFTDADLRTADAWYRRVGRPKAMPVFVTLEREDFPEVLEVGQPGTARGDVRWRVWRSFVGIWLEDIHQGQTLGPGTMAEALNAIDTLLMNEMARAIAKLPEGLIPSQ
jgi:hypothetical protein